MIHNKIEFLNDTTALSPQVRKTMRQPALISSPVILLMLAACTGNNSASTVAVAPTDTGNPTDTGDPTDNAVRITSTVDGTVTKFTSVEGDNVIEGSRFAPETLDYSGDPASVSVNLEDNTATDGWGGTDTLSYIENVVGSAHDDTITGDDLRNRIEGGAGNDRLDGGEGDDKIYGGAGGDTMDGGTGTDILSYALSDTAVTIDLTIAADSNGYITLGSSAGDDAAGDRIKGFEAYHGSDYDDLFIDNGSDNSFTGFDGADTFRFNISNGSSNVITGFTSGDDVIDFTLASTTAVTTLAGLYTALGVTVAQETVDDEIHTVFKNASDETVLTLENFEDTLTLGDFSLNGADII